MTRSVPIFSAMQKKLDVISLISRENLSGNRVIRAFSKQKTECRRVDAATEDLAKTSIRVSRLSALLSPITYAVTDIAIILIVWFGAVDVNLGSMQTGDIVALVSYMTQILLAMVVVANLVTLMTRASASAKRINQVFETVPSVQERNTAPIVVDKNAPKIEFENVSFNYNGDGDEELTSISFSVPRGATVGIIGGTGSGKSTLINLIPRFYDVSTGCVRVDGRDVRDYPFVQLRRQIGIVPQQSTLFSGTVRDNLRWRNSAATDEELIAALQTAQAYEFIQKLPNGLDSRVEQGGKNFSGGQRQRLCIARALVSHPDLLILDDSFSALDLATDAALRKALKDSTSGMTVLIVTQRCSTVRSADLILVISDGVLAGKGTHDELMAGCEVYRDICLSQQTEKEAAR
jgi:ATP-binding cassette subfamily B protein